MQSQLIFLFLVLHSLFWYSICKVTTGTYNLQSVLLSFKSNGTFTAGTSFGTGGPASAALCSLVAFSVNTQS